MTVPHVQLKYQKRILALFAIGSAGHWGGEVGWGGGGASYLGLCLCVSAVHRKIKIQNKFRSGG